MNHWHSVRDRYIVSPMMFVYANTISSVCVIDIQKVDMQSNVVYETLR